MAEPYNSFVNMVAFVDMDISGLLPLNCLSDDYFDHFDQLVTATLFGPLAVLVLVVGVVHPRIGTNASRAKAKKDVEAIIIRILVLIYPTISRIICQSFSVSRGSWVLASHQAPAPSASPKRQPQAPPLKHFKPYPFPTPTPQSAPSMMTVPISS